MCVNKPIAIFAFFCVVLILGCKTKFEKIRTSNNVSKKYQEALRLYNKKDYGSALILFEDLHAQYRGRSESEDLAYYYAYSNYRVRDYYTARELFKSFAETYPQSRRAEECQYMTAYCMYLESPRYSLDQQNTYKALDYFQLFITLYPRSNRVAEATRLMDLLRDKLENKSYHIALLYSDIRDYKSAVVAFRNCLRDYPDTKYAEEMEFLIVKNQFLYAQNSVENKQQERFEEVKEMYISFAEKYPNSKFIKLALQYHNDADSAINTIQILLSNYHKTEKKYHHE